MPSNKLKYFLDTNNIRYVVITHSRAFTADAVAALTHISGNEIAKTVMVKVDAKMTMAIVPASRHVDLNALRKATGAQTVVVVPEPQFADIFPDCEVGAMPPFGTLYGIPVYVDDRLARDPEIAFNAGSHLELIRMTFDDFKRLENPTIASIATRSAHERIEEERLARSA
jgi:Ala-tRNA(Pro) deacylase